MQPNIKEIVLKEVGFFGLIQITQSEFLEPVEQASLLAYT